MNKFLLIYLLSPALSLAMEQQPDTPRKGEESSPLITLHLSKECSIGEFVNLENLVPAPLPSPEMSGPFTRELGEQASPTKRDLRFQRQPRFRDLKLCLPKNIVPRVLFKETLERLYAVEANQKFINAEGEELKGTPLKIKNFDNNVITPRLKTYSYKPIQLFPTDPDLERQKIYACIKIEPLYKGYITKELNTSLEIHGEFESMEIRTDATVQAERSFLVTYLLKNDQSYILNQDFLKQQKEIRNYPETIDPAIIKLAAKRFKLAIYVIDKSEEKSQGEKEIA